MHVSIDEGLLFLSAPRTCGASRRDVSVSWRRGRGGGFFGALHRHRAVGVMSTGTCTHCRVWINTRVKSSGRTTTTTTTPHTHTHPPTTHTKHTTRTHHQLCSLSLTPTPTPTTNHQPPTNHKPQPAQPTQPAHCWPMPCAHQDVRRVNSLTVAIRFAARCHAPTKMFGE